ncbi:hypothetical protein NL533_35435, partial [Klebsiella pneumoniae]|nr:hypothetical protein [Klebsiella pneumoniae]
NMPFGSAHHDSAVLSNEEAWDVAAYVLSHPRPVKEFKQDWPDINRKPFDQSIGPFADSFSAMQHKYGPFQPIRNFQDAH